MDKGVAGRLKSGLTRFAPALFVVSGVLLILVALGMRWQAGERQEALLRACDLAPAVSQAPGGPRSEVTTLTPALSEAPDTTLTPALSEDAGRAPSKSGDPDGRAGLDPLCVLTIPKIDLTVAVTEGVDGRTLRYAVGHFEGTALPGQAGNFSVVGHRNSAFGQFFNRLDEVEVGDLIIVEYAGETHTYAATERLVVGPTDTWVLDPTPDARITLVTCTGPRFAARLVVRGVLRP